MTSHSDRGDFISCVRVFSDGGSKENPGPSAIGVLLFDQRGQRLDAVGEVIGSATSNVAEYRALIRGLDLAAKYTRCRVECYIDSDVVEGQLSSRYRLKSQQLRALFHEVKDLERPFETVTYCKVKRNNQGIRRAHQLVHDALDGRPVSAG